MSYGQPLDKMGQRVNQNNDIVFDNCPRARRERVRDRRRRPRDQPRLHLVRARSPASPPSAPPAPLTSTCSTGRKTYTAGGTDPIINHQIVGYTLVDCAMRLEAARYLCWKAAHYADLYDVESHAIGAMAKIFGGETGGAGGL